MGRESQACRRPEPEERLLFPICDSAPRDTGDPSKSALGAGRKGVSAVWQSRRLYLAPAELLSRRKRGRFLSGARARTRLSLLELPEVERESVWARDRDFCFGSGSAVTMPLQVPGGAGVGREAAPLEQLIRSVSCCKAQVVGLLLVVANDEPGS